MKDPRPLKRYRRTVHEFEPTGMASAYGGSRSLIELECGHRISVKTSQIRRRVRWRCHECPKEKR